MKKWQDKSASVEERARALLAEMSREEKIFQVCSDMHRLSDGEDTRDYRKGNVRSSAHFMHWDFEEKKLVPKTTREAAEQINRDVARSIEESPHGIPFLVHDEALHGAQWGMATSFPQPIALASTFDDELVERVADTIGKECRAVGVRQVLSPVVNVCRDSRWGRTMETFGEDVLLNSNMGVAMCKGFEENGVIATPKHFVDNYADGGRDSNASHSSWRTLREIYAKPFERCIKDGKAKSIMSSYNSVDGMPCACNGKVLNDLLRDEWGFDGFVVCDYGGIGGMIASHHLTDELQKAQGFAMENGHDITLPWHEYETMEKALDEGCLSEEALDRSVLRLLVQKFRLGLMDEPYVDVEAAVALVRNREARELAYEAAKESLILLKNEGILPLSRTAIKKIGVFGQAAEKIPVGENYSGPFGGWQAEDAMSPLEALQKYCEGWAEVIYGDQSDAERLAAECDVALYFTSVVEGEGLDRSNIKLPMVTSARQHDEAALIVDKRELEIKENQEEVIQKIATVNPNTIVVLLNGAPLDVSDWIDKVAAVLEAWYPGEQGGRAIAELLFGGYSPSGKLPICFPRSVGQLPLCYSYKPSGRGYAYNDDDGTPRYPFGYGLSYTHFQLSDCALETDGTSLWVTGTIANVGEMDGAEVLQVYISGKNCYLARPLKELKGYQRIFVRAGEKVDFSIRLDKESFHYYNAAMEYGVHDSDYTITVGNCSDKIEKQFEMKVRNGKIREV